MTILSSQEILDAIIMIAGVAVIFSGTFSHSDNKKNALITAIIIASPAILLHEAAHKIVALLAGFDATFHASYIFLGIGILLKIINAGFIFFVPGYVSINCGTACTPGLLMTGIAFAGPAMNGLLYLGARWYEPRARQEHKHLLQGTRRLNGFLFIINMLPLPGLDGFTVYTTLFSTLF